MIQSKLEQRQVFSYAARDFHGGLYIDHPNVIEPSSLVKVLWSGNTRHGLQVSTPALRRRPTSYFGEESGIGLALRTLGKRRNLRVGVVGLGIGTIAAYGRPGDQLRFYEINPRVAQVAADRFTYLSDTSAQVSIILGDARLSLESEAPQEFDLLALDAFTSDAPPVHLLTRQAFEIYLRQLKPDGVIAVNISNRHLDLKPVLAGIAEHFSLTALHVLNEPKQRRWWMLASEWILLTRDPVFPESSPIADGASRLDPESGTGLVWTDERTSLLDVLN